MSGWAKKNNEAQNMPEHKQNGVPTAGLQTTDWQRKTVCIQCLL